jgi:FkbM family methyltransferase
MSGSDMIKTATNIVKGVFRPRKRKKSEFRQLSWVREKILKHQDDQTIKKLQAGNFTISFKRPYELLHSYTEIFSNELYRFQSVREVPLIIDCGSNIGLSVLFFKAIYPSSKIVAFEPDPNNFLLLQENVRQNHLQNIELNKAAVWTKDGEISFESNESEASHISDNPSSNRVAAVSLRRIMEQYTKIDFLKMDIEGAEWEVMKDVKDLLSRVDNLFLEYHGKARDTNKLNDLITILSTAGLRVYIRNAADNLDRPFIQKETATIYDVQLNLFCYR